MEEKKQKRPRFSFWVGVMCYCLALFTLALAAAGVVPFALFKFEIPLLLLFGIGCIILGRRAQADKK